MTSERPTKKENVEASYWGQARALPFDATFVAAKILAQKEFSVFVSEPGFNIRNEELGEHSKDVVHIYAGDEAEALFDTVEAIPEYDVLEKISNTLGETFDKLVDRCNWGESIKRKVKAFNTQVYANYFQGQAKRVNRLVEQHREAGEDSIRINSAPSTEQRYIAAHLETQGRVKELLGDMQSLSPEEFRELLVDIIDEVIEDPETPRAVKTLSVRQVTRRIVRGEIKLLVQT